MHKERPRNLFFKGILNGIKVLAVIIGLFLLGRIYTIWPNNPAINIETGSIIEGAAISPEQAIKIVMDSNEYKDFDKWSRITHIDLEKVIFGNEFDNLHFERLKRSSGKSVDYDIYYVIVDSTNACSSSPSWLYFHIDPNNGDILESGGWIEC
jgi:hypothetical protein